MATIEQFNEVIERAKTKADFSAVVWMKRTDAQVGVTSIQKRKNQLSVFRQVIAWKDTDHAAIIANGHVMAIWHAQPAFGVGDKVIIRQDAIFDSSPLDNYRDKRAVATITEVYDGQEFDYEIAFGEDKWLMLADELELWKPAEPDEYTRDAEQVRLLARIRELEEGYEAILSELVVARPFNDILDDVRAIAQRMLHAEDATVKDS